MNPPCPQVHMRAKSPTVKLSHHSVLHRASSHYLIVNVFRINKNVILKVQRGEALFQNMWWSAQPRHQQCEEKQVTTVLETPSYWARSGGDFGETTSG